MASIYSYALTPELLSSQVIEARLGLGAEPSSFGALSNLARYLQFPPMNLGAFYERARGIIEGRVLQNFPAALQRLRPLSEDYAEALRLVRQALMTWTPLNDVDGLKDSVEPLAIAHTEFAQAYNREISALFPGEPEIILSQQKAALNLFCTALSAQLERISLKLFELWKADAEATGGELVPIFPRLAILHLLETPGYPVTEPFKEQSDEITALRVLHVKLTPEEKEELLKAIRGEETPLSAAAQEIFNRIGNIHYQLVPRLAILHLVATPEYPVPESFKEQIDEITALRILYTGLTPEAKEELLKAIRGEETPLSAAAQAIFNRIGNIHSQLQNKKKVILNGITQILYQELRKSFSLLEKMESMESFPGIRGPESALRRVFLSLMKQDSITDENGAISPDAVPCDLCSSNELKKAVLDFFKKYNQLTEKEKVNFDCQFLKCIRASTKIHDDKTYLLLRDWSDILSSWGIKMRISLYFKLPQIRDMRDMRYQYTN